MTAKHVLLHCAKAYGKRHEFQPITPPHNPLEQKIERIESIILEKMTTSSDPALPLLLKKIARIKQQLHVPAH